MRRAKRILLFAASWMASGIYGCIFHTDKLNKSQSHPQLEQRRREDESASSSQSGLPDDCFASPEYYCWTRQLNVSLLLLLLLFLPTSSEYRWSSYST